MNVTEALNTDAFAALIGATYRQIDYWTRNNVFGADLFPPGRRCPRRWPADLLEAGRACADAARVCASIGGQKMSPAVHVLAEIVDAVRVRPVDLGEFVAISAAGVERGYLTPATTAAHLFVPLTPVDLILRRVAA